MTPIIHFMTFARKYTYPQPFSKSTNGLHLIGSITHIRVRLQPTVSHLTIWFKFKLSCSILVSAFGNMIRKLPDPSLTGSKLRHVSSVQHIYPMHLHLEGSAIGPPGPAVGAARRCTDPHGS